MLSILNMLVSFITLKVNSHSYFTVNENYLVHFFSLTYYFNWLASDSVFFVPKTLCPIISFFFFYWNLLTYFTCQVLILLFSCFVSFYERNCLPGKFDTILHKILSIMVFVFVDFFPWFYFGIFKYFLEWLFYSYIFFIGNELFILVSSNLIHTCISLLAFYNKIT